MKKEDCRIIFMGTPGFAVESLKALVENNYHVVGVVTNPDKPAGRGQKLRESDVKKYAKKMQLPIIQPGKLKDENFIQTIKEMKPTLQVVVAFKILPPEVFTLPTYGTFNLHASLLPDYRGAAPINHAIMNGEKKTGVTTFFLDTHVDTGKIIDRREVSITEEDTAGSLHDKLMVEGSKLVTDTVQQIIDNNYTLTAQDELLQGRTPKKAPKIFKEDCQIDWSKPVTELHNFIRGLSPYPAAWSEITYNEERHQVKIFQCKPEKASHQKTPGSIETNQKTYLKVSCTDGYLHIFELQLAGKKKMKTSDFLRGFRGIEEYHFD